jgi:general secretion pathway protein A
MSKRATTAPAPEATRAPFPYSDYVRAKAALLEALTGPPFYALLTGVSGTGKSALLRDVVESLDRQRYVTIYLSSTRASMANIVRFLARSLKVATRRSSLETIDEVAKAIRLARGTRHVVYVDEADRLSAETLQEFRVIAECELQDEPLFSVVLSGLPSLADQIDAPIAFPLKRRIGLRCVLRGLCREELVPFLEHRFGADARRVPPGAHDDLFERTQATPGLLDKVVRHTLARSNSRLEVDDFHAALDHAGL